MCKMDQNPNVLTSFSWLNMGKKQKDHQNHCLIFERKIVHSTFSKIKTVSYFIFLKKKIYKILHE